MIRRRTRNNLIPNHRLITQLATRAIRPRRRDVDENLFGVPGEQGGEVRGHGEADDGVFFFFRRVVVRAAFDSIYIIS